jgi:hypothetical protein
MRLLADIAEEAGVALQLHADPWGANPMTRDALQAWYERFGFVARSGDLVPYWPGRLGLAMWRKPASHALNPSLGRDPTPSLNRPVLHKAIRREQEHGLLPHHW